MKHMMIIAALLVLVGGAFAGEEQVYTNAQDWTETDTYHAVPAKLKITGNVAVNQDSAAWDYCVIAVDAGGNPIKLIVDGKPKDELPVVATVAEVEAAYGTVTGATMHKKLLKALLKVAVSRLP